MKKPTILRWLRYQVILFKRSKESKQFAAIAFLGLFMLPILVVSMMKRNNQIEAQRKENEQKKNDQLMRATMKLYKINIVKNFWGVHTEMVMRETPLTEEQLDEIEKDFDKSKYQELLGL